MTQSNDTAKLNILIVANHFACCSARYAADAFTRLGHTVKHVGPAMGRNIWGIQVPEEYVWTPDITHEELISGDWIPRIVIVMDSDPAILDRMSSNPYLSPMIVWAVDNHCRRYERPYFDWYFLAHKSVSIQPYTDNTTWLPVGYDPVAFPPSPIAWADRQFDVCMIGVLYPKRWELVQAMRAAGLKVFAGTGLVYDAYRDAYHKSRVALVSSFNGDLPIRLFEGAGMGCAVLCDPIVDIVKLKDRLGLLSDPFSIYTNTPEAVMMAKTIQDYPAFGKRCQGWVANHTWDVRCQVILDWVEARK